MNTDLLIIIAGVLAVPPVALSLDWIKGRIYRNNAERRIRSIR